MTAYLVVLGILCFVCLGVLGFGIFIGLDDDWEAREWQMFAASITVAVVAIIFWPLTLTLALAGGVCYGLYSTVKVLSMWRKGEL